MADASGADDLLARLEALREDGAAEREPVRFAYLEALTRRVVTQPPAIRDPLLAKLEGLANELSLQRAAAQPEQAPTQAASPLADLLAYIGEAAPAPLDPNTSSSPGATVNRKNRPKSKNTPIGAKAAGPELKAISMFRDDWSRLSTEQQLTQTLAQAPENAGPMNSQHLVLRSLELMRDLAPDYLQGFMSYIDTLVWLEQADPTRTPSGAASAAGPKKAKATRRKTPGS